MLVSFIKQPGALHARPGTHAQIRTLDVSERRQPFEQRVHPAVRRDPGGSHILRVARLILSVSFQEVSPRRAAKLRIMMRAVNRMSEVPAEETSDDHVRSEMLLAGDGRHSDRRCEAIRCNLGGWA